MVTAPALASAWPPDWWPMTMPAKPSASVRSSATSRFSTLALPMPAGDAMAMACDTVVGRSVSTPLPTNWDSLMRRSISSPSSTTSPA